MRPFSSGDKSIKISYDLLGKDKKLDSQELPLWPLLVLYCPSWFYKLTFTFCRVPTTVNRLWLLSKEKNIVQRSFWIVQYTGIHGAVAFNNCQIVLAKKRQILLPHEILIADGTGLRTSVKDG